MKNGVLSNLLRRIFIHNFYLKFIAAVLTLALYIWVSEDREAVIADYARVQIVVPEDMVLVSDPPDRVKVTIRGRWSDINRFDATQLDPIRIDLSRSDRSTTVDISPNMIRVPPGLRVTNVEPNSLFVELEDESYRTVPITPQISGEPHSSYAVESVRVTPQTVTIRGPQSRIDAINAVSTQTVDISDRTRSLRRQVQLRTDDGLVTPELDDPVVVEVDIETQEITHTFEDIPVEAVNTSFNTTVAPATTNITVRGPKPVVETLDPSILRVEIDLSDEDDALPGTYSREAEVFNIPQNITLVSIFPERFRVTTTEP